MRQYSAARGFTLIETLVALVIAAIAASIILGYTRTLMLRAEREHGHQSAVLQVLNDSLRLAHSGVPATSSQTLPEEDHLLLDGYELAKRELPPVRVRNFSLAGEPVPPIAFAYTPFQAFAVTRDRYAVEMIYPALPPPGEPQGPATLPDQPPSRNTAAP